MAEAPFVVGGGDTGVPPGEAPVTTAPLADMKQPAGDNVLAVMEKQFEKLSTPEPAPQTMQLSSSQRFAVAILSALDPDGYQKYVLPTLQGMRAEQQTIAASADRKASREQQAFNALLQIAQRRDEMASREKMESERAEDRDLNRDVAKENLDSLKEQRDALTQARNDDRASAEQMTKSTDTGMKSLMPAIDSYINKVAGTPEHEAALVVKQRAQALQSRFSDFLQSGSPASRSSAQQFATEFQQVQNEFFAASMGRAAREAMAARQNATLTRRNLSLSQATDFDDKSKLPAERVINFAANWNAYQANFPNTINYASTKLGALGSKFIPGGITQLASDWQGAIQGFRSSEIGKAMTKTELETLDKLLAIDMADMTVEQFRSSLNTLTTITGAKYLSHIQAADIAGFEMQPYWDHYNKVVSPLLPPTAAQLIEVPPGSPQGTRATHINDKGIMTVFLPNQLSPVMWVPDTPEEAVFTGRTMQRRHYAKTDISAAISHLGFTGIDHANIMREIFGEEKP